MSVPRTPSIRTTVRTTGRSRRVGVLLAAPAVAAGLVLASGGASSASTPGPDVRLTNDLGGGYVSAYTLATGTPYTDATLTECGRSRGRQNEPSVAVNPRNPLVVVGSSNDYCGVYNAGVDANGAPIPAGPIWLGYYRSQDGGASYRSSLVPGYPGDTSPYAARAAIRTASSGDPVLAWDGDGRLFAGSESSEDPNGTKKGFGDVWVATYANPKGPAGASIDDGKEFVGSTIVSAGSSAPSGGKFNDKTAIAADRTTNAGTRGNVYFAWSRFSGGSGGSNIFFSRSTDHGATFSNPILLTTNENDVQFPDIAITSDGTVTVTWVSELSKGKVVTDAVRYAVSTDGGATFSPAATVATFEGWAAQDVPAAAAASLVQEPDPASLESEAPTGSSRDCGVLVSACTSGYVFFRHDSQARSAADQTPGAARTVYVVLDGSVPGTEVPTGTTYGTVSSGTGSQQAVYATAFDPLGKKAAPAPVRIRPQTVGHQFFPDVAVDKGIAHVIWYDTRNDSCYSPARPIGNCDTTGPLVPALDVYGATLSPSLTVTGEKRLTNVTSDPNLDQFSGRTVPFAGDYLWVDSAGGRTVAVWTDYRDSVKGDDPRTPGTRGDVLQCRTPLATGGFTGDTCPRAGGLDQNIYGDLTP